jgi:hypothetical protein
MKEVLELGTLGLLKSVFYAVPFLIHFYLDPALLVVDFFQAGFSREVVSCLFAFCPANLALSMSRFLLGGF